MTDHARPVVTAFNWVPEIVRGLVRDLRVRWALEEIGRPYETELLDARAPRPEEYLVRQPFHKDKTWVADARPLAVELIERKLKRLADALGDKPWLAGDFSVADIAMVTVLSILRHTDLVAGYPALVAYKARAEDRPAYKRAMAAQLADFTPEPA